MPFGPPLCGPLLVGGVPLLSSVFGLLGKVPLQGLCHRPSHGGLLDHGAPEQVACGVVCLAGCDGFMPSWGYPQPERARVQSRY